MKRLTYILAAILIFSSCEKEDKEEMKPLPTITRDCIKCSENITARNYKDEFGRIKIVKDTTYYYCGADTLNADIGLWQSEDTVFIKGIGWAHRNKHKECYWDEYTKVIR